MPTLNSIERWQPKRQGSSEELKKAAGYEQKVGS